MLRHAFSESVGMRSKMDRISCAWPPMTLTREAVMWAVARAQRPCQAARASPPLRRVLARSSRWCGGMEEAAIVRRMCATAVS